MTEVRTLFAYNELSLISKLLSNNKNHQNAIKKKFKDNTIHFNKKYCILSAVRRAKYYWPCQDEGHVVTIKF